MKEVPEGRYIYRNLLLYFINPGGVAHFIRKDILSETESMKELLLKVKREVMEIKNNTSNT